jgi:hypothetical protein
MLLPQRWRKQLRLARTICLGRAGGLCKNDGFVCAHDWLFACGDHMNVIALGSAHRGGGSQAFLARRFSPTMLDMKLGRLEFAVLLLSAALAGSAGAQQVPSAKNARIILLPRKMVSGNRATIAVLDVNGRLTPGATISFSNGDHVTTNSTGRGLFVAPLTTGVLYATIQGRPGRVQTLVVGPQESKSATQILQAPHFASTRDRFELQGHGFCGDADKNIVQVNGRPALVLAASSESMAILPPDELTAGPADLTVACSNGQASVAHLNLVSLSLEADTSPLRPGETRTLSVRIGGTQERVMLEARNLAPDIAELSGGKPARAISSGGAENIAQFPLTGKQHGNILVSIRLLPGAIRLKP